MKSVWFLISNWFELKNDIVKYVVTADDKLIDGQVELKTIWTAIPQEVAADSDVTGTF
jgi:trigger factor